jgi:hypothetical protein
MKPYQNRSADSGVVAYEITDDSIVIKFRDGGIYRYDHAVTGKNEVEEMKRRALAGKGLATFINRNVRERFAAKLS